METRVLDANNGKLQKPKMLEEPEPGIEDTDTIDGPKQSRKRFRDRRADDLKPRQKALLELVEEQPGLTVGEMAERSGIPPSTCEYTFKRLEKLGLVQNVPNGRNRHFFPAAAQVGLREKLAPFMMDPMKVKVLYALESMAEEWLFPYALARDVGVDPGMVYRMMHALHDKKIVSMKKVKNRWQVKLNEDLKPFLDEIQLLSYPGVEDPFDQGIEVQNKDAPARVSA